MRGRALAQGVYRNRKLPASCALLTRSNTAHTTQDAQKIKINYNKYLLPTFEDRPPLFSSEVSTLLHKDAHYADVIYNQPSTEQSNDDVLKSLNDLKCIISRSTYNLTDGSSTENAVYSNHTDILIF